MTVGSRSVMRVAARPLAVALLLAAGTAPTRAQHGPPSRAFDRVFSQDGAAKTGNFTVFTYEGQDSVSDPGAASVLGSSLPSGMFTGLNSSISLVARRPRIAYDVDGASVVRRFASSGDISVLDTHGAVGLQLVGGRTGFKLRQSVGYTSYYQFLNLSTGAADPMAGASGADRGTSKQSVTTSTTTTEVGRQVTRSLMFSARYTAQYTRFGASSATGTDLRDVQGHDISAKLSRQLGRHTVLFAGYGQRFLSQALQGADPLRAQDIDIGIDRAQQFSFARKTTLEIRTGSSVVSVHDGHRFFLTGNAALRHALSRTWSVSATGRRAVAYIEGLTTPVLVDGFTGYLAGPLGSRMDLGFSGAISRGDIGVTSISSGYTAYAASARLRVLLTRRIGVFGDWTEYAHRFDAGRASGVSQAFDRVLNRQGWRVGLSMNVPLQSERGVR